LLNNLIIAAIPHTEPWGFNTALVMIICNLAAVVIGRFAILGSRGSANANPGNGNNLGVGKPDLFRNFSLPELLATLSFGHILGVGFVLGLTNAGVI
jgi:photosystem I subunit X